MRVVINQMAALVRKTGVGHYTAELVRSLSALSVRDHIEAFPNGWIGSARRVWDRFSSWAASSRQDPSLGSSASSQPIDKSSRKSALSYIRRAGQQAVGRFFQGYFRSPAYDLYHEPNFIPFPSNLPTVATLHDLSVLLHPEWHPADRIAKFEHHFEKGLDQCVHFLTPTEFCRREVIEVLGIAPDRVTCTYEGPRSGLRPMPADEVAQELSRLNLPPRYLLHLGTIEPRKNLLLLMKAYCSLPPALRDECPLLLVGGWGWNARAMADYFHEEGRHRGVIHCGYVADEHLAAIYNGALALVFPSHYEGFGLPPVEMMACGGAVLSSTAGALVETVGSQAFLTPADDLDGWRAAMERVIRDEDWRKRLRQGSLEAARPFTWERCAADTLRVYHQLRGGKAASILPQRMAA